MPTALEDLITPKTKEELLNQSLLGLQGVGTLLKTGTGFGTLSADGVAKGEYSVRIKISSAGSLGVGQFKVSTNGGRTYGSPITIPPSGIYDVVNTGVTLTFAEGTDPGTGNAFEVDDIFAFELTSPTFPTASYVPGSTPLTILEKDAVALEDLHKAVVKIARGGFPGTAEGGWADLIAEEFYNDERIQGSATEGNVVLTDAAGAGPHTLLAGEVWVGTGGGLRYSAIAGGTLPQNGTFTLAVRADRVGSGYNVGAGSINQLLTNLPGVVVSNPNPLGGSWITKAGADRETNSALARRMRAKWPELSTGTTEEVYFSWAKKASGNVVTRAFIRASLTVAGQVEVFLASNAGTVDPSVVAAVLAYIDPLLSFPITVLVQSAVAHPVTVTGTLYVRPGFAVSAEAGAVQNVSALFNSGVNTVAEEMPGIDIGGTVYPSNIIEQLELPAGVRNITLAAPASNVVLGTTEVATLVLNLTVVEI